MDVTALARKWCPQHKDDPAPGWVCSDPPMTLICACGALAAAIREALDRQAVEIDVTLAAHRAVIRELAEAYDRCDSNRGAFSCVEPHDLRCPKSRADSPQKWKGKWQCECGRERLDAALAHPLVQQARETSHD